MHFSSYPQLAAKPSRKLIANCKASEDTALLLLEPIRMKRCPVQQPNREVLRRIGKITLTPRLNRACSITGAYARLIFLIIDQLFHTHTHIARPKAEAYTKQLACKPVGTFTELLAFNISDR